MLAVSNVVPVGTDTPREELVDGEEHAISRTASLASLCADLGFAVGVATAEGGARPTTWPYRWVAVRFQRTFSPPRAAGQKNASTTSSTGTSCKKAATSQRWNSPNCLSRNCGAVSEYYARSRVPAKLAPNAPLR